MMKYQDIHTTDSALWKQYQDYMAKGEYDAAKTILAQTQLDNKRIDASLFNGITTELTRLQNQGKDSTWSKNTMVVSYEQPSGMQAGECYCKLDRKYGVWKVTVSGLSDIPRYYIDNELAMRPMEFYVVSRGGSQPIISEDSDDGIYYVYRAVDVKVALLPVYTRYGATKSGKTEVYINGEKSGEGKQSPLTDWTLNESENVYNVKMDNQWNVQYKYSPFVIPMFLNGAGTQGNTFDDVRTVHFNSDVDIIFTHSVNEEEGNLYLRCDINTH